MEALVLFLLIFIVSTASVADAFVGFNIGPNTPPPAQVAALLNAQNIHHVKLYNADQNMLSALANTGISVAVSLPPDQIPPVSLSNSSAADWISRNIEPHLPATNITTICLNSNPPNSTLLNALINLHSALKSSNLDNKIKISAPFSSTIIFNHSLNSILLPTLKFLNSTNSFLMINIHPYLDYIQSNGTVPLNHTLDSFSIIDSVSSAMADLNLTNLPIIISETGWPSEGGPNEPDANPENARTYNTNLIKHILNKTRTPKQSAYIYELYNEDTTSGRNWGAFEMNGDPVYALQLSASDAATNGSSNQTYCTAKTGAKASALQAALDWACGVGKVDCSDLMQGKPCYEPDTLFDHATYAFDSYYNRMGKAQGSCDFNGVATVTSISPSHGSCTFSQSDNKGSSTNSSVAGMDSERSYSSASFIRHSVFSAANALVFVVGCWITFLF